MLFPFAETGIPMMTVASESSLNQIHCSHLGLWIKTFVELIDQV
jgi:hypothetical protein